MKKLEIGVSRNQIGMNSSESFEAMALAMMSDWRCVGSHTNKVSGYEKQFYMGQRPPTIINNVI
jgi:hypothetical protein